MSLAAKVLSWFRRDERKLIDPRHPKDPGLVEIFQLGRGGYAGVSVTETSAMSWTAIWAGVRFLSETMATLPLHVYERLDERRKRTLPSHPIARLVRMGPNPEMTWPEWAEVMMAQILLFGHGRSQIIWNNRGEPIELWPIHYDRIKPERSATDALVYRVTVPDKLGAFGSMGGSVILPADEVLDIRGFSSTGLCGERMVHKFREAIGLGLATEEFAARFFGQGANASGFLSHPGQLSEKARERLDKAIAQQIGGLSKAHRYLLLEEGMQWHQLMVDPQKAQALELRKFQVNEAARILRLPPHILGDLERATFSNIEHQGIELVKFSLLPWGVRWEKRLDKQLLSLNAEGRVYTKFNFAALERGDIKTRYEAYAIGRQNSWLSVNDILALEDMNPVANGDTRIEPVNMRPLGSAPTEQPTPQPAGAGDGQKDDPEDRPNSQVAA